ncbi:RseA family anti-sigma factor [Candidatus Enterovibrio escicola]|uniref:RseA family anti-sigma factor n=1 Tax=Candidatus Enterovibrio escicola TaxID=1927127 RepID=UPI001237A338|nr:RseA family anti-sigma factor [Candidatus Enterovibrio escacola]
MAGKKNLSALFDGDITVLSPIEELGNDVSAQEAWKSFSITRDVMRGDMPKDMNWNISYDVAVALEKEQTYSMQQVEGLTFIQVPKTIQNIARHGIQFWLEQLTKISMAATISLAVIICVQKYNADTVTDSMLEGIQPSVLLTIPLSSSAEPVSLSRESQQSPFSEEQARGQRRRINAIFQDYEFRLRLNTDEIVEKDDLLTLTVGTQD